MVEFFRPSVTVDVAVLNWHQGAFSLLLIQRGNPPFAGCWALPGGFIEPEETLEASARRELKEETGMEAGELFEVGCFGDPGRDPRGRTISVVYYTLLKDFQGDVSGQDDATAAQWFPLQALPALAFDHTLIVQQVRQAVATHFSGKFWRQPPDSWSTAEHVAAAQAC